MTRYEIRVESKPVHDWADRFQELQLRTTGEEGQEQSGLLTGDLPDQSALLGVLMRLHNLNLTVLLVRKIEEQGITGER